MNGSVAEIAGGLAVSRKPRRRSRPRAVPPDAVRVGRLVAFDGRGNPLVEIHPEVRGRLVPARSLAALSAADLGREVALLLERHDVDRPIVVGCLCASAPPVGPAGAAGAPVQFTIDGDRIVLQAAREIVLQCGESSITLTRAGKVLIRGAYVLSRSSGVNRIKGGSVQIN